MKQVTLMTLTIRQSLALLLCLALATPGCASAGGVRYQGISYQGVQQAAPSGADPALFVSYVKALPIGSRVKVTIMNGDRIRGTLMQVTGDAIVVQENTRVPEAPRQLAIATLRAVEPDTGGGAGRAIAIGAAVGAGAALGVLMLIAALAYND
jgi:hypothetical protein